MNDAERARLGDREWKTWGPYLSERSWGTVREDYSEHGTAWDSFPHDHARSRAYRWSEDGLAGICDDQQTLCLAFAFWNGCDPILKERIFGLTGPQGNHGEDAKEYWFYEDSTPTHSWMRWRYFYPQAEFPYSQLVDENARRGPDQPEFELLDTGVFDEDRYWDIAVDYAKADCDDIVVLVTVRNAGPAEATLHVLPTLWFRNTWSWGLDDRKPTIVATENGLVTSHHSHASMRLSGDGSPQLLFCDNETNARRLWNVDGASFPKDAINDHVVDGMATTNPAQAGTKAALWYQVAVAAGGTEQITLRLHRDGVAPGTAPADVMSARRAEADEFYAALTPTSATGDEAMVLRRALGGMLWSKQFYHYDVARWLDGDPAQPPPPAARLTGRNSAWRHLNNHDVISMPDKWEYPWYAAWDLGFHAVALAHVDPTFAKEQLILLCREWYMHPNGQLPAYEWAFGDVNPPVHAWAALRVFEIDGGTDFEFLERMMHKLVINFTWWVNRKDADGNNVFAGGFLGLDNIGPIDRSAPLPIDGALEQSDGTSWMAMYCLDLLEMSLTLARHDRTYEDLATKFFEHFALIAEAMYTRGLWDEEDGFYYDVLATTAGDRIPLKVRSMVGLLPLAATTTLGRETLDKLTGFAERMEWFMKHRPDYSELFHIHERDGGEGRLLSIVSPDRLRRVLGRLLDDNEFLSAHGVRALSAAHRDHPFSVDLGGMIYTVGYSPGESTTGLFGGNSNWRGPVWFPVNYIVIEALRRFARFFGGDFSIDYPTGSGTQQTLGQVADHLGQRLIDIFVPDDNGRRPVFGTDEKFQKDPVWNRMIPFNEYFHGDNGRGLGASHQTGWTGLVADLIIRRGQPR
ncbi:MAG: MGH1-like glycoside hydrolase domain-containing protein [Ilumatobacteraceae bacterium]